MVERRKTQRTETQKNASVSFGVVAFVDCAISNISSAGACLEFPFRPVLPRDFSMIIKPEYTRRACRVAWQSGSRVGVVFNGRR
jgi:hypothetical protein